MASFNGAKHCKVDDKKGHIKEDFDADLVLFDEDINIKLTIIEGKIVFNNKGPKSRLRSNTTSLRKFNSTKIKFYSLISMFPPN